MYELCPSLRGEARYQGRAH